jgi:hypothetical protein
MSHPAKSSKLPFNPFDLKGSNKFAKYKKLSKATVHLNAKKRFSTVNSMSEEAEEDLRAQWLLTQKMTGLSVLKHTLRQ